jgi:hypothetical protein
MIQPGKVAPLYAADLCNAAYQLNWAISLFPSGTVPDISTWLAQPRRALEQDGVRLIAEPICSPNAIELWASTTPQLAPAAILRLVKGRFQYAIGNAGPKVFRRNYRLESVGSAKRDVVEQYVAGQPNRHSMADARVQKLC